MVLPWKRSPKIAAQMLGMQRMVCDFCQLKSSHLMEKTIRHSQPHPPGSRRTLLWHKSSLSVGSTRLSPITSQSPSLELSAGFCPSPPPPLSLSLHRTIATFLCIFSFLHLFSFINVCPFAKSYKALLLYNPLWWMQECVCGINFIFEIEVLCSIACWLRSEPPLKVCINLYFLNDDPL